MTISLDKKVLTKIDNLTPKIADQRMKTKDGLKNRDSKHSISSTINSYNVSNSKRFSSPYVNQLVVRDKVEVNVEGVNNGRLIHSNSTSIQLAYFGCLSYAFY